MQDKVEQLSEQGILIRKELENWQQIQFHSRSIRQLKGMLGSKCSYLSWERDKDNYSIKATIEGRVIRVALGGTPKDVGAEEYDNLFKKLNDYAKKI